jgi:hypothetical protein
MYTIQSLLAVGTSIYVVVSVCIYTTVLYTVQPTGKSQMCCAAVLSTTQSLPQSTQSDGPVCFLIFYSINISLLASLVAGRRPQCNAGSD